MFSLRTRYECRFLSILIQIRQFKIPTSSHKLSAMDDPIQNCLFIKDYLKLQKLLQTSPSSSIKDQTKKIFIRYAELKLQLYQEVTRNKEVTQFRKFNQLIEEIAKQNSKGINPQIINIHRLAMKAFLFEISSHQQNQEREQQEKSFLKDLHRLPYLSQVITNRDVGDLCQKSKYFKFSLLELYVRKCTKIRRKEIRKDLQVLDTVIEKQFLQNKSLLVQTLLRKLYMIVLHVKLSHTNNYTNDLTSHLAEYLDLAIRRIQGETFLINMETVVVLLYNCLKILVGLNEIDPALMKYLDRLYTRFRMKSPGKLYSWHILEFFFVIKIVIFQENQQNPMENKKKIKQHGQLEAYETQVSIFQQKFSDFINLNLDQIIVSLNELTRSIIRHKVASLSTMIGVKLGISRFSKNFLQIMHDSAFNNDIQTIKLCFQLFEAREYQKIEHLLHIVLSAPATNKVKQKEVLVSMCSILTGLYLENRSQALLYCKLNHSQYLQDKKMGENASGEVLREETLLAHVGFAYYNLASNETYLENRHVYLAKALENFLLSYQLNHENYLLSYCIGKVYLQLHDYHNAYRYAMEACKSFRGSWAPFCLLSCVYMCERKFQKANILVEELLKKNMEVPILHYIKAYLEVNKVLLEVEHDQEIQAAKMLGEEFYLSHFERILKSKSTHNVLQHCQHFYQLSIGVPATETDENFFSPQNVLPDDISLHQKELFLIIELLFEIGQFGIIQNLFKVMPKSDLSTMYYKALLHERRKEWKEAHAEYKTILKLNPCHCDTLIRLAMLAQQGLEDDNDAIRYLELAGKFVNTNDYLLAKGLVYSRAGRITEANQALLINAETAWCGQLPDLLYYY